MKYRFKINYNTVFGENLEFLTLKSGKVQKAYPMQYSADGEWYVELEGKLSFTDYYYRVVYEDKITKEFGVRKVLDIPQKKSVEVLDNWNKFNFPENYLCKPFFSSSKKRHYKPKVTSSATHYITIKAAIPANAKLVMVGNCKPLKNWNVKQAIELKEVEKGVFQTSLNLQKIDFSSQYKFGIKIKDKVVLEEGNNRILPPNTSKDKLLVVNEVYYKYTNNQMPRKAGLAIPVFSLRTHNSLGIGEFSDLKLMADWLEKTGISLLQILPINDTIAHHSWLDCYPYAAISVYALNPFYLSISNLKVDFSIDDLDKLQQQAKELNASPSVDLEKVMQYKWEWIKKLFIENKKNILKNKKFKEFINKNKEWLYSYCVFCVQRDKYSTANFLEWKTLSKYNAKSVSKYFSSTHKDFLSVMMYVWVQYQLHLQLTDAVDYLHQKNINIKGDLPIGIYRHSVEAWKEPELFGMDFQAGAPPDDFAVLGQNWEFPTYNWEIMQQDQLQWWRSRFTALAQYFDAMRIDHILGFFRIWRIPKHATQGIMGYFYPSIPITEKELYNKGVSFSYERFCVPFINQEVLYNQFGEEAYNISQFFMEGERNSLRFKEEYNSQRKLVEFWKENSDFGHFKTQLLYLQSNVIFLPEEKEKEVVYHPRFSVSTTESFKYLSLEDQQRVAEIYNNYYFHRQDDMWQESAMEKLPTLLETTNMLICGEDLGLVPTCVPKVMDDLAILSLQVQRMTNDDRLYSNPAYAPYLSVVTPATHDTSTIRQWWEEDRSVTQNYYNHQLQRVGEAPPHATSEILEQIVRQHLQSPAMLAVIPVQEYLALLEETTNSNKDEERINIPAVFPHYWNYRIHISLEELIENQTLTAKIQDLVEKSGRG